MRKALLALSLAPLWAGCASAQLLTVGVGGAGIGPASASFTGPGDVVASATMWWGLRAYTAAIAAAGTQKLVNISRASDSHTCDILVATNGGLGNTANCSIGGDSGQSASSFCNATTCSVVKLYDQSGGGFDATSVTTFPLLTFNCINTTLPCLQATGAGNQFNITTSAHPLTTAQPLTFSVVVKRTGATTTAQDQLSQFSNGFNTIGPSIGFTASTNTYRMFAGTTQSFTVSDSAWHAINALFSGASSAVNVDGSEPTLGGTVGTGGLTNSDVFYVGKNGAGGPMLNAEMTEAGFWSSGFNGTQRTNMCHNQFTYWATGTSC